MKKNGLFSKIYNQTGIFVSYYDTMLIFKQEKIVCHLWDNRMVEAGTAVNEKDFRNYAIYFTLQVNWILRDIRTTLWQREDWTYVQDWFTSVINVLSDIWYTLSGENLWQVYNEINFLEWPQVTEED